MAIVILRTNKIYTDFKLNLFNMYVLKICPVEYKIKNKISCHILIVSSYFAGKRGFGFGAKTLFLIFWTPQ